MKYLNLGQIYDSQIPDSQFYDGDVHSRQPHETSPHSESLVDFQNIVADVADVMRTSPQPLRVEDLVSQMSAWGLPTQSIGSAVNRALNRLYQAVPVAAGQYGWLSHLLDGRIFRHPLANDEARRGFLLMDELEHAVFFPQFFQSHRPDNRMLTIELLGGPTIEAKAYIEKRTWSLALGSEFVEWLDLLGGQEGDSVMIMVDDATAGKYTLRLQPYEGRDDNAIQSRNIHLALVAEEIVREEGNGRDAVPAWELAARLVGRGVYDDPTPPDDLHCVLHQYSLLHFNSDAGYSAAPVKDGRAQTQLSPQAKSNGLNPLYDIPAVDGKHNDVWNESEADTTELDACVNLFAEHTDTEADIYEAYLDNLELFGEGDLPLSHADYFILKAELDSLVKIEKRFGALLSEQQMRKELLSDLLFIDTDSVQDDDINYSGYADFDEPFL